MIQTLSEMFKRSRAFTLALILILSSFASFAQTATPAQRPEAPPYSWPRSHDYDVMHYRIALSFDWSNDSIAGETTVTLRPMKSNLKEIELDAGDMKINSVHLASGPTLKFRYVDNEKLFVALDKDYPAGTELHIAINYAATPKKGLTFIKPTPEDPSRPYQIWSQGESEDNHYWFPCYDYPNDKATTELIATVDENLQVISNGSLVEVQTDAAKKTRTYHWKMDRPYSSYLVSIIVGQFAEIKKQYKTVPVVSYVYADKVNDARLSLGKIDQMVAFFSKRLGFDFPYPKYAQTTVRDFGGGMENITATTLTDTAVHDARAHLDVSSDGLISHELGHSWFGDLLTCRDWGELWLNESFATLMGALWTEHDLGRDDYLYEMFQNQDAYFQAWAQGTRRPIVTKRYSDPDSLFDTYAYPRGGAVLNMLRFTLGEELFWKAMKHYLEKNQWQNVETQQLVIAIEEATGQNLQWFFDEWVYKMGHPEFEISSSYDEKTHSLRLTVKQTQKPDDARPWFESPEFFTMPVDIAVTTASGEKIHRVMIDAKEKEFTFPVDSKPLIVNFDRGNYIIKQVKFDRSDDEIAYQLLHDSDVMGRIRAAIELKEHHNDAAAKALSQAAQTDKFWGVRIEAVKSLAGFKSDASRASLIEATKDTDSRIRREAIKALAEFKDAKLAGLFTKIINTDQSYFAVAEAERALGATGAPQAFEVLVSALKMDSWQETIRAGALNGLALLKDPRAFELGVKYAAPGNAVNLRGAALLLIAEVGKENRRALEILLAAMKERSLQVRLAAAQALGTLGDAKAIPLLEELSKAADVPEFLRRQIAQIIEQIKNPKKDEKKN
ncbi:MAG TPA: DUF3458 domain-containing protein [Blastocatellia bacterium]|nr:DUF3458 domain-containing protein [Blastocatellia bacterium]